MKIAYFVTKFPYDQYNAQYLYGGASIASKNLAIAMDKRCHEIDIFTTSIDSCDSHQNVRNISIHRYGTNHQVLTSNISFGMFYKPLKHNADIAHVHFDIPPGPFIGFQYAALKRIPLVVTYHGDWDEGFGGFIRRASLALHNKYLVNKLLDHANIIISPSKQYADQSKFLKKYRKKIVVIPNGINLDDFNVSYSKDQCKELLGYPLNKKIILFLGFLTPYKGPDVLLNAMSKIIKEVPNVILVFAGTGSMKAELESLSINFSIEENVRFEGFVDENLKALYFKAADIFCLPSIMSTECYPLAVLEAMASGVPVIASEIGGIPDAVRNGENGLLFKPNDSDALATAAIFLLKEEDARIRMGEDGKEKAKQYSWEKIAEMTERVYEELKR